MIKILIQKKPSKITKFTNSDKQNYLYTAMDRNNALYDKQWMQNQTKGTKNIEVT